MVVSVDLRILDLRGDQFMQAGLDASPSHYFNTEMPIGVFTICRSHLAFAPTTISMDKTQDNMFSRACQVVANSTCLHNILCYTTAQLLQIASGWPLTWQD
jgi:hypothetical protein